MKMFDFGAYQDLRAYALTCKIHLSHAFWGISRNLNKNPFFSQTFFRLKPIFTKNKLHVFEQQNRFFRKFRNVFEISRKLLIHIRKIFPELTLSPISDIFQIISKGVTQYSQDDRDRMHNDSIIRATQMRDGLDDCTTEMRTYFSADMSAQKIVSTPVSTCLDTSAIDDAVIKGLASTNQLIKILSGDEFPKESSLSESVSVFLCNFMSHMCFAIT